MLKEKILKSLCYYDKRNPDCCLDEEELEIRKQAEKKQREYLPPKIPCYCDNCFHGRTELAEDLLKQIENK